MKILMVEDEPAFVGIVEDLLEEAQGDDDRRWTIATVASIKAACRQLAVENFDAILLDLGLPDSEGLAGLERLLAVAPKTPIVIHTSLDDHDTALEAVRRGAQDYLVKGSFSRTSLQRTLLYAVARNQASGRSTAVATRVEKTIGRYRVLKVLGSGGMGKVFLALQEGAGGFSKKVAIKRLLSDRAEDDSTVQQFLAEARLAAKLDHPNIVQIFELGESVEGYFIAMEYVPGCDLRRLMHLARDAGRMLPLKCTAHIVSSICQGLDNAHNHTDDIGQAAGLVHFDVCPANVLISEKGIVKLTDFGIARLLGKEGHDERLSGRLPFMAPERLRGEPSDHRVDIFAVGLILYELCTGSHPFRRVDADSTGKAILRGKYIPPEVARQDLPPALADLIHRSLANSPQERIGSARRMTEILQDLFPPDVRTVEQTAEIMIQLLETGVDLAISEAPTADIG